MSDDCDDIEWFLPVHNSSIGYLVTHDSLTQDFTTWHTNSDPRDLWPLRQLVRVMGKNGLTNILTMLTNFDFFLQILQFFTMLTILTKLRNFENFVFFLILRIFEFFSSQFWDFLTIDTTCIIVYNFHNNLFLPIAKTILETCNIWDTGYNSVNWEREFWKSLWSNN